MSTGAQLLGGVALAEIVARYPRSGELGVDARVLPARNNSALAAVRVGEERWVLKHHSPQRTSPRRLRQVHWLQREFAAAGCPVVIPLHTREDDTVVQLAGNYFTAHPWVEGSVVDYAHELPGAQASAALAVELARLHRVGRELFAREPARWRRPEILVGPARYARNIWRLRSLGLRRVKWLRAKPRKSIMDRWAIETFARLAPKAQQLATLDARRFAEVCYIHNDIYWGNLVFADDQKLAAFIDFDKAAVSSWAYEVGCAAALCAADSGALDRFLATYERESGSTLDRPTLVTAMMTKVVRSSLWCVQAHLLQSAADPEWLRGWALYLGRCLEGVERFAHSG